MGEENLFFFFSKQKKRLYKFCVGSREAKVGPSEPPAFERADEKSSTFGCFIASRLDDWKWADGTEHQQRRGCVRLFGLIGRRGSVAGRRSSGLTSAARVPHVATGGCSPADTLSLPTAEILPGRSWRYGRSLERSSHVVVARGTGCSVRRQRQQYRIAPQTPPSRPSLPSPHPASLPGFRKDAAGQFTKFSINSSAAIFKQRLYIRPCVNNFTHPALVYMWRGKEGGGGLHWGLAKVTGRLSRSVCVSVVTFVLEWSMKSIGSFGIHVTFLFFYLFTFGLWPSAGTKKNNNCLHLLICDFRKNNDRFFCCFVGGGGSQPVFSLFCL